MRLEPTPPESGIPVARGNGAGARPALEPWQALEPSGKTPRFGFPLVLVSVLLGLVPLPAEASLESRYLVIQGTDHLALQQFERALENFIAAAHSDPADVEAVFYQGLALNRLGRHEEALARLEQARQMGAPHPDLPFETGWSLLHLRRWKEALRELDQYERTAPGRGQTSEFRGRAYYALGEYDKAEALLGEATRRDPNLAPSARLFLALVAEARKDLDAARRQLQAILEETPESPLARAIRDRLAVLAQTAALAKPFRLNVALAGGFNDNVVALGSGLQLPADISRKHSWFDTSALETSYTWQPASGDTLTVGYRLLATVFPGLSSFDLLDHFTYLDYRHGFRRDLSASLRVSNQFTQVGGTNFRNQVGVRPAVAWWPVDWGAVEVAYSYFHGDYVFTTPAVLDRDSEIHTLAVTSFLRVPGLPVQGQVGYFHLWNFADGGDFDFQSDGVFVGITASPVPQLAAEVFYSRTFSRHDKLNSLSGTQGFEFKRSDEADRVTAQVSWSFFEWLRVSFRYDFITQDSNIGFFDFNQSSFTGGITFLLPP